MIKSIADIRRDYKMATLDEQSIGDDPFAQFDVWWSDAVASEIDEVNAFTLCTMDAGGEPDGRIVLLKGYNREGFVFFTNYNSNKGQQLADNPLASMVFFWKELERQVRITGDVKKVSEQESDAYFNSRPKASRIGAIASAQSRIVEHRGLLEEKYAELTEAFATEEPERPQHWGGYRVVPYRFEFWQGRPSRMHDRFQYTIADSAWQRHRLFP